MEVAFACNVDSTVGGTSDEFSGTMIRWWAGDGGRVSASAARRVGGERDTEVVLKRLQRLHSTPIIGRL